ncbi:hypothetical protein [Geomonas subterranea]|uniref:hypothetical protein n=1 Tax=Geomonas subterranea TaxID=2847989 RepID=UPI001CD470B5|nr:hypothetical protein [Geomonas fuzhouensis]
MLSALLRPVMAVAILAASFTSASAGEGPQASISLETVPMILSAGKVPADPGAAGKATLAGVDSNHNGIRDDAERWIGESFPDCARFRAALAQVAFVVQKRITLPEITEKRKEEVEAEEGAATACFAASFDSCSSASFEKFIQFSILLQNTPERAKAYGRIAPRPPVQTAADPCVIPAAQLPN